MKVEIITPGTKLTLDLNQFGVGQLIHKAVELASVNGKKFDIATVSAMSAVEKEIKKATDFSAYIPKYGVLEEGKKVLDPDRERTGGKGFLIAQCSQCGDVRAFCTKYPIRHYKCKCGQKTELRNLKKVTAVCPDCGKESTYYTNLTRPVHTMNCVECGAPFKIGLTRNRDEYATVRK